MITDKLIQQRFVETILEKYGARIEEAIKQGITENRYQGSGTLYSSVSNSVQASPDYFNGLLAIGMKLRGRFLDIQATHKYKWNTENPEKNKKSYQKTTKPTGFYSRNAYGSIGSIVYSLMYYLTDDVVQGIKQELEAANG
ncbi:hypothetical protein [uncultured Draconibacterium sp.]|uniref:hypothetical protein n=1 Tax=uncultured Draconibacterium sp. TaxID=1573823 RepID=UPI0025D43C37|nr:hypothetical protein [uncultured Draconibacterium sp.]